MTPVRRIFRDRPARFAAALAFLLASLATLGFPGCEEDLTSPGTPNPAAHTMSNCWPNDDQRFWSYRDSISLLVVDSFPPLPPNRTPARVTLAHAQQLLQDDVAYAGAVGEFGYGLVFNGEITTDSGVRSQYLEELFYRPRDANTGVRPATDDARTRLLARVAAARPDLRARIVARVPALAFRPAGGGQITPWPYLIHGYAWRKSSTFLGTYGDVDTLLAWQFLDSSVRPGHGFDFQLVPSLAPDVWLHALVEREVGVDLPNGESATGLEVVYLLDYGVVELTDEAGNVLGACRSFDYGRVTYVPGVGPVKDLERRDAAATTGLTHGRYELRIDLVATGIRPVVAPALAAR